MWRVVIGLLCFASALSCSACDGYTYEGMDGAQALSVANGKKLPEAYEFYIDTYTETSPPMLDVAKTFRRFGNDGINYIIARALKANNSNEFEADMAALLILDSQCSKEAKLKLEQKAKSLEVDPAFVISGCS